MSQDEGESKKHIRIEEQSSQVDSSAVKEPKEMAKGSVPIP